MHEKQHNFVQLACDTRPQFVTQVFSYKFVVTKGYFFRLWKSSSRATEYMFSQADTQEFPFNSISIFQLIQHWTDPLSVFKGIDCDVTLLVICGNVYIMCHGCHYVPVCCLFAEFLAHIPLNAWDSFCPKSFLHSDERTH